MDGANGADSVDVSSVAAVAVGAIVSDPMATVVPIPPPDSSDIVAGDALVNSFSADVAGGESMGSDVTGEVAAVLDAMKSVDDAVVAPGRGDVLFVVMVVIGEVTLSVVLLKTGLNDVVSRSPELSV